MLPVFKLFYLNNAGKVVEHTITLGYLQLWEGPLLQVLPPPPPPTSPMKREWARSVQHANNDVSIVKEMKNSVGIQETDPQIKDLLAKYKH